MKTNENINGAALKEAFIEKLKSTNRNGIESVIENLEKTDFFTSPASSKFHDAFECGLLHHSTEVFKQLTYLTRLQKDKLNPFVNVDRNSIVITALLHDVCKVNTYEWAFVKNAKDENGNWYEKFDWKKREDNALPCGHGEKSVMMLLRWGLELTEEEICAIRWHMGAWDLSNYGETKTGYNSACARYPLVSLLQCADVLASKLSEFEKLEQST